MKRSLLILGLIMVAGLSSARAGELTERVILVLEEGLRADSFWPAMHAAEGLTAAGKGRMVQELLNPRLAQETDDQRRCGLARELVRAGDVDKAAVMHAILLDPNSPGRVHAAESLYKVGWRGPAFGLPAAAAQTEDMILRLVALAALARHGDDAERSAALDVLRDILAEHDDENVLRLTAWVLGRVGDRSDIDLMAARYAQLTSERPRLFFTCAMARLGHESSRAALLEYLESSDVSARIYAAVFAGESNLSAAIPLLTRQLDDEDLDARIRAAHALINLGAVNL